MQREIPADIADKLRLRLSGESKARLTQAYTENFEAYQLYLLGSLLLGEVDARWSKEAIGYFEAAINKDPNYALAYAGLADAYLFGAGAGGGSLKKKPIAAGRKQRRRLFLSIRSLEKRMPR